MVRNRIPASDCNIRRVRVLFMSTRSSQLLISEKSILLLTAQGCRLSVSESVSDGSGRGRSGRARGWPRGLALYFLLSLFGMRYQPAGCRCTEGVVDGLALYGQQT